MKNELVLACCLSAAAAVPLSASTVNVRPAKVTVATGVAIRAACGQVDTACTRLDAVELYCDCIEHGDHWSPRVRVDVQPRMYISSVNYVVHEFSHLFDFKLAMVRNADAVESRVFASQLLCESFLGITRAAFPETLLAYRRESMRLRDHAEGGGR
jgi:hypothetical protein